MIRLLTALFVLIATAAIADEPPRLAPGTAAEIFRTSEGAATTTLPGSHAPLLARVTPAIVSVFPARLMKETEQDDPLGRFFGRTKEESEKERERVRSLGSGVILAPDGWIVTNSHVVHLPSGKIADAISVELSDRRRFPAKVAGVDPATDLALLKIGGSGLPALPIADSDSVKIGDLVFAVGNPFKVGITSTMGMVSALRRTIGINGPGGFEDFIQTDAAINPGNSGGALVDASGRLVGINSAIYGGSGGNVGIGFAIPSNLMRAIVVRLAEEGKIARGFFGLQTEELDTDGAAAAKLERIAGARVSAVMEGGPAAKSGLQPRDVILKAAGRDVETRPELRLAMSLVKPGGTIELEFSRDGVRKTASITAIADPDSVGGAAFEIAALPGIKLRAEERTLVVAEVSPAAKKTQLEAGMEILEINGDPAATASAAESALRKGVNKVKVRAADGERTLAVRIE